MNQPVAAPTALSPTSDDATMRREAIDPGLSVFVSANAGSGKTTILTRRVIRLLLAGAPPARILCLTYTKAAAAEMQDRVFKTLGAWVRLDDPALRAELTELTGKPPRRDDLSRARALFAAAVETPGGLKIQTIHAFAERLLHLFPFEANVPVRFEVMDDFGKAELVEQAKRATIRAAMAKPGSALGRAFMQLADIVAEEAFDGLIATAMPLLRKVPAGARTRQAWRATMAGALGINPGESEEMVAEALIEAVLPRRTWADSLACVAALPAKLRKRDDEAFISGLAACQNTRGAGAQADVLIDLFTKRDGDVRKTMLNKGAADALPDLVEALAAGGERLPAERERLRAVRTIDRSVALMVVTDAIVSRFRAHKAARALVDFDDMIDKALALVKSQNGASWVLMKLDGGIDHVLIDEAQDTTPEMWEIVQALTAEFFAGEGARAAGRTVFAVGDEKQSIYSFQGARPQAFADTRQHFQRKIAEVDRHFRHHELKLSFRTVLDVLQAVDAVFAAEARYDGLASDNVATVHETARHKEAGSVELWPLELPPEKTAKDAWAEVDAPHKSAADVVLAEKLAADIAERIAKETFAEKGKPRPVTAGDIMILVQRRDGFFDAIIRALKRLNVPVAGADRVRLTEEIGVLDLIAAAKVALLPEDDLALAEALKSPLIGLDDTALTALAVGRSGSLHAALAASSAYAEAFAAVEQWRRLAATLSPYQFFSHLLGPLGGRRKLLARLGPDAADGIELFLANVLGRETREPPSLAGEIAAFSLLTGDVKRDQDQAGAAVRVLTVHGAKGLEAPIVYLPDASRLPLMKDGGIFPADEQDDAAARVLLWAGRKDERPAAMTARRAEEELLRMQEYRRLFYVAMTRAKDRLVIAGWGKPERLKETCWYAMAQAAFDENSERVASARTLNGLPMRRWQLKADTERQLILPEQPPASALAPLPAWLAQPAPDDAGALPPIRPSRALHAADQVISPERDAARQRGDLVHLLLERLPALGEGDRRAGAARLIASHAPRLGPREANRLTERVLELMRAPALQPLFGPQSRGEVALTGTVRGREILGRIDRLAVLEDRIIIADFKTGRGPSRARAVVQLALYSALIEGIYPGRRVEAHLIWTDEGRDEVISGGEMAVSLEVFGTTPS